jgi:hypothetical protein
MNRLKHQYHDQMTVSNPCKYSKCLGGILTTIDKIHARVKVWQERIGSFTMGSLTFHFSILTEPHESYFARRFVGTLVSDMQGKNGNTTQMSCLNFALRCEAKFHCTTFLYCNVSGVEHISCDEPDDTALPTGIPGLFFITAEHVD